LIKRYDLRSKRETASFNVPAGTNFDIAVFSPDGQYVATDDPDRSVALWDLGNQQQIRKLAGPGSPVSSISFSPLHQSLASAFVGGTYRVWDLNSGEQKFEGHSELPRPPLAFSPDGKQMAVGLKPNAAGIIDAETGTSLRSFSIPGDILELLFFSPDGRTVFATTNDGHLYSWNSHDAQSRAFSESHANEVISFSFAPDGKTLATGSVDRTVRIWDGATGKELRKIVGHGAWVTSVQWSADGRFLLSGDADGLIKLWDTATNELPVWPSPKPESVSATTFTSAGQLIALGRNSDGDLRLWNLSNGAILANLGKANAISSAAFSRDALLVAAAVPPDIRIFSVASGKLISLLPASDQSVYSVDFSADSAKLLSGDTLGKVLLWDVANGRVEARLNGGNMYYRAVFSRDGKQIASADQDGKIRIWDVASRTIRQTLIGHAGVAKLLSFSPDGQLLASAADDNTVRLWNTASGTEARPAITSRSVERLAFSPDGKRLVTGSFDGAIVLWDVGRAQEILTLQKSGSQPPSAISFSSDGLMLAVSDIAGAVRVWQGARPGY